MKFTYNKRSSLILVGDNVHDGVGVELDVVILVPREVGVGAVPVPNQGDLVLVVAGPECNWGMGLKSSNLKTFKWRYQSIESSLTVKGSIYTEIRNFLKNSSYQGQS